MAVVHFVTWSKSRPATLPSIMEEFDVDLNSAINGLISWAVFTLGIGVNASVFRWVKRT